MGGKVEAEQVGEETKHVGEERIASSWVRRELVKWMRSGYSKEVWMAKGMRY